MKEEQVYSIKNVVRGKKFEFKEGQVVYLSKGTKIRFDREATLEYPIKASIE